MVVSGIGARAPLGKISPRPRPSHEGIVHLALTVLSPVEEETALDSSSPAGGSVRAALSATRVAAGGAGSSARSLSSQLRAKVPIKEESASSIKASPLSFPPTRDEIRFSFPHGARTGSPGFGRRASAFLHTEGRSAFSPLRKAKEGSSGSDHKITPFLPTATP